jgi:ABC-type nitrate/sulfonate/bicarbonate transport system substrate-binding protein
MRVRHRSARLLGQASLAVLLTIGAGPAATAQAPVTEGSQPDAAKTVRVISFSGIATIPLVVAQSQGFFAKHGITAVVEFTPNSTVLRQGLAAGKFDIAHAAVDNAIAMAETDGADVVIALGSDDSMNELIVQPGIESVAALKGKTVAVDAPNTAYALQLRKILLLNGLTSGQDYTMKAVGGTPQRLQAMLQDKELAASMLNPPSSIQARHGGLKSLGTASQLIGPYQGVGAFAMRAWAKDNRETFVKYLAAYIEALRWFVAPANKTAALALLTTSLKVTPEVAAEAYAQGIAAKGGLAKDAKLDVEGVKNVLKLRAEIEKQWQGTPPPPEKYIDLSFHQAALALIAKGSR